MANPEGKIYTAKVEMNAFVMDPTYGVYNPVGKVYEGDYLGELVGKKKKEKTDSYYWEFYIPGKFTGMIQNNQGFATGERHYFLLAEPDEVGYEEIKTAGPTANDADKAAKMLGEYGKMMMKWIVGILAAYFIGKLVLDKVFFKKGE